MAWIESHQSLQTHRKTLRLSRQLGISRVQVIGHLHCLWWWCLDNAPDGDVTELDPMDIATASLWDGDPGIFLAELIDSGFIDRDGDNLEVHDWWEFAGKHLERSHWNALRRSLSPQVMERDDYRCARCGSRKDLTVDHITPIARGGRSDGSNLQTLCRSCNSRKWAHMPVGGDA